MKANKSVIRSRLTDEHLQATLRVATPKEFKPNIGLLADAKRCQLSSQNKTVTVMPNKFALLTTYFCLLDF